MLFRIFAGFLSAFLTVRRQETDRQTGLCQLIRNTALNIGFFQSAKVRVLLSKSSQPLFQSGVVGVDICLVLALIKENDCFFLNLRQSRHSSPPYGFSTHAACSKSSDTTFQHPQQSSQSKVVSTTPESWFLRTTRIFRKLAIKDFHYIDYFSSVFYKKLLLSYSSAS